MGKFVSSINGIQKSFPGSQITQGALDTFKGAKRLARQSLDWMKSTQNLVQNFDKLPIEVQSQVKLRVGEFTKAGGTLAECQAALEAFRDFPWEEEEVPSKTAVPSATIEPTEAASIQSTQRTSAVQSTSGESSASMTSTIQSTSSTVTPSQTSSSSSDAPKPTPYTNYSHTIFTKTGTSFEVFKKFVDELDGGRGALVNLGSFEQQMYLTCLNETQASDIKQLYEFVDMVLTRPILDENIDGSLEEFRAANRIRSGREGVGETQTMQTLWKSRWSAASSAPTSHLISRTLLPSDPDAPWWKKILSALPRDIDGPNSGPEFDPPYLVDESLGRGVTIYVLDDGFDVSNAVCTSWHIGSHRLTIIGSPSRKPCD